MKRKNNRWIPAMLALAVMLLPTIAMGADIPLMTKDELKAAMTGGDINILDVRAGRDWTASEFKIAGAVRADPGKVDAWANDLSKEKTAVLYCA
ncbi:MAG: hypothetical protein JEZ11_08615 [Desulfobacterales bacterium]|nr:hypothetical protein [Desulfobacterales bacterium]